jgi:hypothetical protein
VSASLGDPVVADASLHLLADHLAEALAEGELSPCLLHVGGIGADGFDLGVLPLDGQHPTGLLLGHRAPDDWHAVGMATSGWAYHAAERADPGRRRHRVHLATLVSRTGEHAHRIRCDDPELEAQLAADAPGGEQVDLLRRSLGLPTDPPPCLPSTYWTVQWLAALVEPGHAIGSFADAIDRHPAMRLLRSGVPHGDDDAVDVLAAFHRVLTWERMRSLAAAGRFPVPELEPDDAEWLDEGAFARFLLNRCPPLAVLRARLDDHLPPGVADAVDDILDELDVPDCSWPDLAGPPGMP